MAVRSIYTCALEWYVVVLQEGYREVSACEVSGACSTMLQGAEDKESRTHGDEGSPKHEVRLRNMVHPETVMHRPHTCMQFRSYNKRYYHPL